MCGIAGFIDQQINTDDREHLISKMLRCTTHRGPDSTDSLILDEVVLGHNRLKIIDLSDEANQPLPYEDLLIIFNGEVYNYVELKSDLQKDGYTFKTRTDTEVIGAAYKKWGKQCVKHFVGMWAFAIWDSSKKELFCSRDRFGIKPFYYIFQDGRFYFASEFEPLKQTPVFNGKLNFDHLNRGIFLGWTEYKDETFFDQIKTLAPRHNITYSNNSIKIEKYWDIDLDKPKLDISQEEKQETFRNLFLESVKIHSRSDVSLGGCLSGGLDSSAIASALGTLFPDIDFKTFTIFYEGNKNVDERPFVYEVVKKYPNIIPHYFSPTHQDLQDSFHKIARHTEVPLMGSSFISQYFLMGLAAKNNVTVLLDGQGADEILAGYMHTIYRMIGENYRNVKFGKAFRTLLSHKNRQSLNSKEFGLFFLKSIYSALNDEQSIFAHEYKKNYKLANSKAPARIPFAFERHSDNALDNFLYDLIYTTSLPTLLHYEDRTSMAFSRESRVPFLDHRLVEFLFSLPDEDKLNPKAETKYILRHSLKKILPKPIYERKDKKGFVTPGETQWLRGPLKDLLEIDLKQFDWLDSARIEQTVTDYKNGNNKNVKLVWRLATTNYWLKNL